MRYSTAALNATVLTTFAQPGLVWVGASAQPIDGVLTEPRLNAKLGDVPLDRLDPVFVVDTADWLALNAAANARLDVGDRRFTIVKPRADDGGMTELVLRAFV
jgi:hypothetical protein